MPLAGLLEDLLPSEELDRMFQPESVYVEVSGICSAKCPYCVKGNGLQKQGKYISQADFRKILDHLKKHSLLPKRNIINLYIWGEPLLHPEINEILSIVGEYGQKAYMSTFLPRPPKLTRASLQILHGMTLSLSGITRNPMDASMDTRWMQCCTTSIC